MVTYPTKVKQPSGYFHQVFYKKTCIKNINYLIYFCFEFFPSCTFNKEVHC